MDTITVGLVLLLAVVVSELLSRMLRLAVPRPRVQLAPDLCSFGSGRARSGARPVGASCASSTCWTRAFASERPPAPGTPSAQHLRGHPFLPQTPPMIARSVAPSCRLAALACAAGLLTAATRASAQSMTDREAKDEMVRRASLFCAGFSNERGLPGINAVSVDALRVLIVHNYTVCPDRRLSDDVGVVWNSNYGVLLWNPANAKSVAALATVANALTHANEYPNALSVYDVQGKALKNQMVPAFQPRDTFTRF